MKVPQTEFDGLTLTDWKRTKFSAAWRRRALPMFGLEVGFGGICGAIWQPQDMSVAEAEMLGVVKNDSPDRGIMQAAAKDSKKVRSPAWSSSLRHTLLGQS